MTADPMLPNFLIVGVAKSGTTSLYQYLRHHPQIFMTQPKDLNFFSVDRRWEWGIDWYARHFRGAADAIAIGEASTSYTQARFRGVALERMASTLPDVRCILLTRHPIARARSSYLNVVRRGVERLPIEQAMVEESDFVQQGLYWRTVQDLLRHVDRERLLVLRSDHLRYDRASTLERVHRFLAVDPSPTVAIDAEFNRSGDGDRVQRELTRWFSATRLGVRAGEMVPRRMKPALHRLTRRTPLPVRQEISAQLAQRLIDYLRDDLRALGAFLGEDLSIWETWPPPPGSD
jgi:hypothetical protein